MQERKYAGMHPIMTATVAELTEFIESKYPIGSSTNGAFAVTGEPYVSIGHQFSIPSIPGVVDEGEARELAEDETSACWTARSAFENYAEGREGVLYWRQKPMLEWYKGRCSVFMRLLISDKMVEAL